MATKRIYSILLLFTLWCLSEQQGPDIEQIRQMIDEFVNELIACYDIPGATVAAVRDGQIVTAKGYGVRNLDTEEPTRDRDLFVIASVTKQFVATVVGHVLLKHNLTWDTPVRQILGDWFYWKDPYRTAKVTVRDALAHRTGLPRHDRLRIYNYTIREMYEKIRFLDTTAEIRSQYKYNNLMYGLVGYVATTLEGGKSWEDLAKEIIFEPLGMNDTTFVHLSRDRWGEYATPYRYSDGLRREVSLEHPALHYQTISAPGGIASNAGDMARWLMALLAGGRDQQGRQVFNPQVLEDMREISMPIGGSQSYLRPFDPVTLTMGESYGLGLRNGYHRGYSLATHTGAQVYLSMLNMVTDMNVGVFSSVSLGSSNNFRLNVNAYIMDLLLGYEPFLNSTNACPGELYGSYNADLNADEMTDDFDDYDADKFMERIPYPGSGLYDEANTIGVYTDLAYGAVVVYRNSTDDELYLSYGPLARWRLITLEEDLTYTGEGQEPYWSLGIDLVEFNSCDSQPCTSVEVSFDRESPPTFHRIPQQAPLPNPPCPSQ